jgi:hypothetical protein
MCYAAVVPDQTIEDDSQLLFYAFAYTNTRGIILKIRRSSKCTDMGYLDGIHGAKVNCFVLFLGGCLLGDANIHLSK